MSVENRPNPRDLHVHPVVAVILAATAALALSWASIALPAHLRGPISGADALLALCLVIATILAHQQPLNVSRHTHVYVTSVAYYLMAALLPPPLAASAAAVACLLAEASVRRRTGTIWTDILALASRRTLLVLAASVVAHLSTSGTDHTVLLLAAALIFLVGEVVTFPIIVYRLTRRSPVQIMLATARQVYLIESAQYLVAVLAALAWGRQFWALGLLAAPTVLVYLAFRASAEAQDARASAQQAAEALRESEERYRGLFENASDVVFTLDPSGTFTSVNRAGERLLGYSQAEILGMSFSQIIDAAGQPLLTELLAGEPDLPVGATREIDVVASGGKRVTVEVSTQAVYSESRLVGIQGIARDVTERRRAEAERAGRARELAARILEAQESERKRISRELHDETAQSLSVLLTNLDLIDRQVQDGNRPLRDALNRAGALARRALDEVRSLSHDLRPTILDDVGLCPALEWLGSEYEQTYGGNVLIRANGRTTEALSDEEELALFRIAQEALTNSGKHGRSTEVTVTLDVSPPLATLTVEDNGPGFDARKVRRPSREGHLGLYGMRERAALLDGTLEILSAPGEGTRVRVTVPLSTTAGQDRPAALTEVT